MAAGALAAIAAALALLTAGSAAAQAVTLTTPGPLLKDNDALPRVAKPATAAEAAVNQLLAAQDARWLAYLATCKGQPDAYSTRDVEVTLAGPSFLSFNIRYEDYCGGASPDNWGMALVYDLAAGKEARWEALFPAGVATSHIDTAKDAFSGLTVISPKLQALYLKAVKVDPDGGADPAWWNGCKDVFSAPKTPFLATLDAKGDGLTLVPADIARSSLTCTEAETISLANLKALGAVPAMLAAIQAAHAAAPQKP